MDSPTKRTNHPRLKKLHLLLQDSPEGATTSTTHGLHMIGLRSRLHAVGSRTPHTPIGIVHERQGQQAVVALEQREGRARGGAGGAAGAGDLGFGFLLWFGCR